MIRSIRHRWPAIVKVVPLLLVKVWVALMLTGYTVNAQDDHYFFDGNKLYADVKKYVSFGIHRTGTHGDVETSTWIKKQLEINGFRTDYTYFPVTQFYLDKCYAEIGEKKIETFPLWYAKDANVNVTGVIVDPLHGDFEMYTGKIVLLRLPAGGQINKNIVDMINPVIEAGAKGILAISTNDAGERVAYNTMENMKPWSIPIVIVAPKDSSGIIEAAHKKTVITLTITGTIKSIKARNVVGKIGTGANYVIISTPISGWFTCGGERGPGVAIFNALAAWIAKQKYPYTFIFTANSGHELDNEGAHAFIKQLAPKPDDVYLWLHLGAGIATFDWENTSSGLVKTTTVDARRNIMYSANLEASINQAFENVAGRRWKIKDQAVGELSVISAHGYKRFFGVAYGHKLHHMPVDDETTTSPEMLEAIAIAIKRTLELELSGAAIKSKL